MPIYLGSTRIKQVYLGSTEKKHIYLGSTLKFSAENKILDGDDSSVTTWYGYCMDTGGGSYGQKTFTLGTAANINSTNGNVYMKIAALANKKFTIECNHSTVGYNRILFKSKKVDLTSYTKATLTYTRSGTVVGERPKFVITDAGRPSGYLEPSYIAYASMSSTGTSEATATINITSVTGEHYVGVQWYGERGTIQNEVFTISKIVLE